MAGHQARPVKTMRHMSENTHEIQQDNPDHWLAFLDHCLEENMRRKRELTKALERPMEETLLTAAERFHDEFLKQDEILRILRTAVQDNWGNDTGHKDLQKSLQLLKLYGNLREFREEFLTLSEDFHRYLLDLGSVN